MTPPADRLAEIEEQLRRCRETNKSLNRRLQSAESGLAAKIEEMQRAGISFGRSFANAAATMYEGKFREAEAELARVTAENARLRDALERIADPAIMEMCSTSRPHPWVYVARIALGGTEGP